MYILYIPSLIQNQVMYITMGLNLKNRQKVYYTELYLHASSASKL